MAEIINLRHARKTRARNEKAEKASEKRRVHGRSKAERLSEEQERKRLEQELDGKKLD
jgi:hypothetical protein